MVVLELWYGASSYVCTQLVYFTVSKSPARVSLLKHELHNNTKIKDESMNGRQVNGADLEFDLYLFLFLLVFDKVRSSQRDM